MKYSYSCFPYYLEKKTQLYEYFKGQTGEISHKKTWTKLRNRNFVRETESLFIAAQNNATRTDYIKAKIYQTQQNSKLL